MTKFLPIYRRAGLAAAICTCALVAASQAHAETSTWVTNEGGRMRLVVLSAGPDGTRQAALQIEPAPGWITYWREPGDSGIPPAVTISPDSPFQLEAMAFPVPKRIDDGPVHDIGYDAPVTLPLTLAGPPPGKDAKLTASAFIGLCKNICIPFQADFSLALPAGEEKAADGAEIVSTAHALLPEQPSASFAVKEHALSPDMKQLRLVLALPEKSAKAPQIIVTGPSGYAFMDHSATEAANGDLVVDMPIGKLPKNYKAAGKHWGVLVISGDRAMETTLAFN